jgi:hypothetical protein
MQVFIRSLDVTQESESSMKSHLPLSILFALQLSTIACSSSDDGGSNPASGGATSTGGLGNVAGTGTSGASVGGNGPGSSATNTVGGSASGGGTTAASTPGTSTFTGKLFINEVCPSNKSGAMDEAGAYPDWIELYNGSTEDISLSGFHLTDAADDPTKSSLDGSLTIKAGGVLLLWADGDRDEQGALHTTFSLSAAEEGVFLFDATGKLVDSTTWTNAAADTAFARFPDGTGAFTWCAAGSPNRTNGASCKTANP